MPEIRSHPADEDWPIYCKRHTSCLKIGVFFSDFDSFVDRMNWMRLLSISLSLFRFPVIPVHRLARCLAASIGHLNVCWLAWRWCREQRQTVRRSEIKIFSNRMDCIMFREWIWSHKFNYTIAYWWPCISSRKTVIASATLLVRIYYTHWDGHGLGHEQQHTQTRIQTHAKNRTQFWDERSN